METSEMTEAKPTNRDLHVDMERLREQMSDMKTTVMEIYATKQDKVKASVVVPFLLYLIVTAFTGVWWASSISNTQQVILANLESAGTDRFYGKDGAALERYMQTRLDSIDERDKIVLRELDQLNDQVSRMGSIVTTNTQIIRQLEDHARHPVTGRYNTGPGGTGYNFNAGHGPGEEK